MKRVLLLAALVATGLSATAQKALAPAGKKHELRKFDANAKPQRIDPDMKADESKGRPSASPRSVQNLAGSDWASNIGYTYFDLQSYGSNSTLIQQSSGSDLSVIWQYGKGNRRGGRLVGYNAFSASQNRWLHTDAITTPGSMGDSCNFLVTSWIRANCASTNLGGAFGATGRLGWPNLITNGSREAIAAYAAPPDPAALTRIHTYQPLNNAASGANFAANRNDFDTVARDLTKEAVFHLTASGGGYSYMLTATTDFDNHPSLLLNGTANNIVVYRSTDVGTSWTPLYIPQISAANGIGGVKGTSYAIDAHGNHVAVVAQVMLARPDNGIATYLYKSSNNGDSWTARLIQKRTSADTSFRVGANFILATDGAYSVALDNNFNAHVTSHAGYGTLDSAGAATGTFYMNGGFGTPAASALYYWNESMADNAGFREIAAPVDINRNGTLDFPQYSAANGPGPYPQGGLGMSNVTVDANNHLYITYSAVVEGTQATSNPNVTRDIYVVASYDGGNNWTNPINVPGRLVINNCFTADDGSTGAGLYEEFYPTTPRRIGADNKLHIAFLSDDIAGLARSGTTISALAGWPNWRGNQVNHIGIDIPTIEGSYLKSVFPSQVCAGSTVNLNVISPTSRLCIYGNLDNSSVFRAELDTTGTSAFDPATTVLLGTFTGNGNGGSIAAQFPNWQGNGHIRIIVLNGDANANPPTYNSTSGEYPITVTLGAPATPGAVTGLTSTQAPVLANSTICGNVSVVVNVPGVANANLFQWSVTPSSAANIQVNGDPSIGSSTSLVNFFPGYTGPVTIEARAVNGCGISQPSTLSFTVGGGVVTFNSSAGQFVSSVSGGEWESAPTITGPFAALSPAVTAPVLPVNGLGDGFYRYNVAGSCATNIVNWASTSINNTQLSNVVSVYPNPARDKFVVAMHSVAGKANVTVFNSMGQLVKATELEVAENVGGSTALTTEGMGKGIYFVRINAGGATTTKRLVIE